MISKGMYPEKVNRRWKIIRRWLTFITFILARKIINMARSCEQTVSPWPFV